jgi:hypothetical protein
MLDVLTNHAPVPVGRVFFQDRPSSQELHRLLKKDSADLLFMQKSKDCTTRATGCQWHKANAKLPRPPALPEQQR